MRCSINLRISLAILGIFCGGTAGPMFALMFSNWSAASFALISAFLAAFTLALHICYKQGRVTDWKPADFYYPRLLGCCSMFLGLVSLVVFLVLGGVLRQGLTGAWLHGENYWIASVWAWMTLKWGFAVFWYSHTYGKFCQHNEETHLLTEKAHLDLERTF